MKNKLNLISFIINALAVALLLNTDTQLWVIWVNAFAMWFNLITWSSANFSIKQFTKWLYLNYGATTKEKHILLQANVIEEMFNKLGVKLVPENKTKRRLYPSEITKKYKNRLPKYFRGAILT